MGPITVVEPVCVFGFESLSGPFAPNVNSGGLFSNFFVLYCTYFGRIVSNLASWGS